MSKDVDLDLLRAEGRKQLLTDPMTHALAQLISNLLNEEARSERGEALSRDERYLVRMAVGLATLLVDLDEDGTPKVVALMRQSAEAALVRFMEKRTDPLDLSAFEGWKSL